MDHLNAICRRKFMNKKVSENSLKPLIDVGWKILNDRNSISKTYKFKSFIEAFSFPLDVKPSHRQISPVLLTRT